MNESIKLVECPRDAMQGMKEFVPTDLKIAYINLLLRCGFDTIDFGSFVSPKAIPQMRDTAEVLKGLDLDGQTKLLSIIANKRGAEEALVFEEIDYLGYPFSVSETFQLRNTNATLEESMSRVGEIQNLVSQKGKKMVVYLSMGFGNPYGDAWSPEIVLEWSQRLNNEFGISILALSDTVGMAHKEQIEPLFSLLMKELPEVEFGAHLHTTFDKADEVIAAAFSSGCRRFDSAMKGFGGCPMAKDDLTGNLPTELLLRWLNDHNVYLGIREDEFTQAYDFSARIFS
jgi:hydroxymethylglutaryl-CoA lyase